MTVKTHLGHATIDNKVSAIDEATLITREEEDRLCLLDGFAEATSWEMNFSAVPLRRIISEPVL